MSARDVTIEDGDVILTVGTERLVLHPISAIDMALDLYRAARVASERELELFHQRLIEIEREPA